MHLFTRSETYKRNVQVTGGGGSTSTDFGNVNDRNLDTSVNAQWIVFDFRRTIVIDSIWIKSSNAVNIDLFSNTSFGLGNTILGTYSADDGIIQAFNFTPRSSRYFGIIARPNNSPVDFDEIIFMCHMLSIEHVDDYPRTIHPIRKDRGGNAYKLADGTIATYEGLTQRGKLDLTIGWEHLRKSIVDELESIWIGPPKQPILTVYPEPSEYPDRIHQMWWNDDFEFSPVPQSYELVNYDFDNPPRPDDIEVEHYFKGKIRLEEV